MKHFARVVSVAVAIVCVACGQSDEQVTAKLKDAVAAAKVDTSSLTIETKGPLITLSGTVASQNDRDEITRIVRQSSGGKDILDKMQVRTVAIAPSAPTGVQVTTVPSGSRPAEPGPAATTAVATDSSQDAHHPVADAAKTTGSAVTTAAKVSGEAVVDASKVTADATVDAAKVTGNAAAKGASATASGAKKLGVGIANAVTPGEKSEKK